MSPESEHDPSSLKPASDGGESPVPGSAREVSPVLRNVLQQILSITENDMAGIKGDTALRGELLRVASIHADEQFSLDPVVQSLVGVIIRKIQPLTETQQSTIQKSVARTLFEDVSSRMRIERLWEQLKRLSRDGK